MSTIAAGVTWLVVTAGAGLAVACALLRWPPARRRIVARAWCLIVPHQVRAGYARAWPGRRSRLPYVLSASPARYGERVQVWCPPGTDTARLLAARGFIAAACRARDVRVIPPPGHERLVTLEVIRHEYPERTTLAPHRDALPPPGAEPAEDNPTEPAAAGRRGDTMARSGLGPGFFFPELDRAD